MGGRAGGVGPGGRAGGVGWGAGRSGGATGSDGDLHVAAGLELPRRRVDPECGVLGVYLRARAGGMLAGWGGVGWDVCGGEGGGGRGGQRHWNGM